MSERDEQPIETAPEGSHCVEHPERAALVTCPRCGDFVCITCWHQSVRRCHACLTRDPGPPVPWADPERSLPDRFFATLGQALRPRHSAPTFARGDWHKGITFFLLSFVPVAMVAGVIPYTFRLGFGPRWSIHPIGVSSGAEIALDVARAAGLGLALIGAKLAVLASVYLVMLRGYGRTLENRPGRQVMLYRAWLLPCAVIVLGLTQWGLPIEPTEEMLWVVYAGYLAPLFVLMSGMSSAARLVGGVGPVAVLLVVLLPFGALILTDPLIDQVLSPWMPDPEAMRQAAGG